MNSMMLSIVMPEWTNCVLQVIVVPIVTLAVTARLARIAMRRKFATLIAGLALLMFGCAIYAQQGGLIAPVCNSISSFFLSRGDYGSPSAAGVQDLPGGLYYVFHIAVIVYVLSILLAFFGVGLVNRMAVACRVFFNRPMNVFWGCSDEDCCLAASIGKDADSSVVFALHDKLRLWTQMQDDDVVHELTRIGWKWMYADPGSCRLLLRAERHFILGSNGHENVACAEALVRRIHGNAAKVTLYVRVGAATDADVVYKWADRWNGDDGRNIEIVLVREDALVSRRFLNRYPMLQCPRIKIDTNRATVSGDFKVLILGFGAQGKSLLNDMICDAQYMSAEGGVVPFEAHVFDHDPTSYGAYEAMCAEAVSRYHAKFAQLEIGTAEFWKRIQSEVSHRAYNRVVVCLSDDVENVAIASGIARIYKEMRISPVGVVFARVKNSLVGACVATAWGDDEERRMFTPFGSLDETYSFANVVTRKWEKGAVWLNGDYNKKFDDPHDASLDAMLWKKASSFNKESSRASFFHQRNLMRLIGYCVDETCDINDGFRDDAPKNHLEILAEDEHLRWMAFHFVRGVKVWSPSEQEIEERIAKTGKAAAHNAIADINAHADLVDYSKLPAVDSKFYMVNARHGYISNKDTQEKDKGFVRSEAMRQSGLGIKKI